MSRYLVNRSRANISLGIYSAVPIWLIYGNWFIFTRVRLDHKMEYCCHSWIWAVHFSLSSIHRVQNRLYGLLGEDLFSTQQPLSHMRKVGSLPLFWRYSNRNRSDGLCSFVPPIQTFITRTRHANFTELNQFHFSISWKANIFTWYTSCFLFRHAYITLYFILVLLKGCGKQRFYNYKRLLNKTSELHST